MNPKDSEIAANYIYNMLEGSKVVRLKTLLHEILGHCNNNVSHLQRRCRNVPDLESCLMKDLSHLFMFVVENKKVSRYCKELHSGQLSADKYFKGILKLYDGSVHFMDLRRHIEEAPNDIKKFIQYFYPGKEFKLYLQQRPQIFFIRCDGDVCLIELESVRFFKKIMMQAKSSMRVTNLRARVGQAPVHIRTYVNQHYPGNEFLHFLQNHVDSFRVDTSGWVHLVK